MKHSGENSAAQYGAARTALFDAVGALRSAGFNDGFVLVGAQAVYLRTTDVQLPASPYTFDADFAVDPQRFPNARSIYEALVNSGFELRGTTSGLFRRTTTSAEAALEGWVDILVPELSQHLWNADGYTRQDSLAAMVQPGLELTLTDNDILDVASLETNDERHIAMRVAGPMSLLVAKGWKIGERFEQGADAFAETEKDILDIYRLLKATPLEELRSAILAVPAAAADTHNVARVGTRHLRKLCTNDGAGLLLLRNVLPGELGAVEAESLSVLADRFCRLVDEQLA